MGLLPQLHPHPSVALEALAVVAEEVIGEAVGVEAACRAAAAMATWEVSTVATDASCAFLDANFSSLLHLHALAFL